MKDDNIRLKADIDRAWAKPVDIEVFKMTSIPNGKDAIALLKELFNIEQTFVSRIVVDASMDSVTTVAIDSYAKVGDIDISKSEISRDDVIDQCKYEVTIRRL